MNKTTKKLVISGLYIATYVTILALTASVSFGQIQVRLANSCYALAYLFPFLPLPAGLAVLLSNIMFGGLGVYDAVGGFLVGLLTTYVVSLVRKRNMGMSWIIVPIILIPALLVPTWLSVLIHVPYKILVLSVGMGQIIPSLVGLAIVKMLKGAGLEWRE